MLFLLSGVYLRCCRVQVHQTVRLGTTAIVMSLKRFVKRVHWGDGRMRAEQAVLIYVLIERTDIHKRALLRTPE